MLLSLIEVCKKTFVNCSERKNAESNICETAVDVISTNYVFFKMNITQVVFVSSTINQILVYENWIRQVNAEKFTGLD